ncbi:MAG: hypothetical protein IJX81_01525 [Clostridia bacterium]|nr:hypothetical protein [Clostridia bacterium]
MDTFYEESAVNQNARKGERNYKIVNFFYYLFLILSVLTGVGVVFNIPLPLGAGASQEQVEYAALQRTWFFMILFLFITFLGFTIILNLLRRRINVSYDYVFVSGELRIAKVFNVNKRKLVTRLTQEEILQVGDVDSSAYDRLRADPQTKEVICTSNSVAAEGKFFLYVLAVESVKKLYVLECREELLLNMMQYLRRDILDRDYIPQAKKNVQR